MVQTICNDCKSNNVKSRTNYSHGKKSSSITSFVCKNCGSTSIDVSSPDSRNRRRRR